MGSSKSYKGGPGWQGRNTPGGDAKVSSGPIVKPEGTGMSSGEGGRKGHGGRNKSTSGKMGSKPKTIYGG